jgi:hypothetical protein
MGLPIAELARAIEVNPNTLPLRLPAVAVLAKHSKQFSLEDNLAIGVEHKSACVTYRIAASPAKLK